MRLERLLLGLWLASTSATGAAAQATEVVEQADKGVFRILSQSASGLGSGTGFLIEEGGLLLTNHHVIEGGETLFVLRQTGHYNELLPAKVIAFDPGFDMAIISAPGLQGGRVLKFAPAGPARSQRVFALGFPGLADLSRWTDLKSLRKDLNYTTSSVTLGEVNRIVPESWGGTGPIIELIQHSAAVRPGNSGGPLLDVCGDVVGINTAIRSDEMSETLHLASSATDIRRFLLAAKAPYQIAVETCGGEIAVADATGPATDDPPQLNVFAYGGIGALVLFGGAAFAFAFVRRDAVRKGGRAERIRTPETPARLATSSAPASDQATALLRRSDAGLAMPPHDWTLKLEGRSERVGLKFRHSDLVRGLILGRDPGLDMTLVDGSVSRRHAKLGGGGEAPEIVDLGSTNGTFVNGRKLAPHMSCRLMHGDRVKLGALSGQVSREDPR